MRVLTSSSFWFGSSSESRTDSITRRFLVRFSNGFDAKALLVRQPFKVRQALARAV